MTNPADGTVIAIPAGGETAVEFEFSNEAPFVAAFVLEIDGLPDASWAGGLGTPGQVMAPAYGGGTVTAVLKPPANAAPGDHQLKVRLMSEGAIVGSGERTLTLRVEAGERAEPPEPPPAPVPEAAAPASEAPVRPAAAPKTRAKPASKPQPDPDEPPAVAEPSPEAAVAVAVPPTPRVEEIDPPRSVPAPPPPAAAAAPEVIPETPKPEPPVTIAAAQPPEPEPPAPVAAVEPPKPEPPAPLPAAEPPRPAPAASEPPRQTARAVPIRPAVPAPAPQPAPPPMPEEVLQVVEMEEAAPPEEAEPDRPTIEDPAEGAVISLKPGGTMDIRFNIHNEAARERTFVVEEDRSLPIEWIRLIQDRVNISHNATGHVVARVLPSVNAEPGSYPFQLRYGPQGGILTPCNLVLQVLPTPAVSLTAKTTAERTGPFGRAVSFTLSVASAGNADTAFRIAVQAPSSETGDAQAVSTPHEVYETDSWRYLFDRELESLESSGDRAPTPKTVRLQLWRKGFWWLGFREHHKVRVAAIPVTDPTNGGKSGNVVELTASRWRMLPLPGFLGIPLLMLLLILLGSGAHDIDVTNGKAVGDRWYVIQPKADNPQEGVAVGKMAAKLTWNSPFYALLSLDTNDKPPQTFRFVHSGFDRMLSAGDRGSDRTLEVRPALYGHGELVNVTYVPVWTVGRLRVSAGPPIAPRPLTPGAVDEEIGTDHVKVQGAAATIRLTRGQYLPVNFENTTPFGGAGGRYIHVWVVSRPAADQVECLDLKDSYDLGPGRLEVPVKLKLLTDNLDQNQELVFLTTDARCQVLRLKLEVAR